METTATRLNQLMNERGLKQSDILALCKPFCKKYNIKLGKSDLSQYVSGKTKPKQEKLTVLGMALNVREDWLMGFDVDRKRPVETTYIGEGDFNTLQRFISEVQIIDFTDDEMNELINFAKYLISKRGAKND